MIREELKNLIGRAISAANLGSHEIQIERPEDKAHGDYSTSVALKLAKMFKMAPMKIAENLQPRIFRLKPDLFDKIEIAEPGFINFFISYLLSLISNTFFLALIFFLCYNRQVHR